MLPNHQSLYVQAGQESDIEQKGQLIYYGVVFFLILEYFNPARFFPFLITLHFNTLVAMSVFLLCLVKGQRQLRSPLQEKLFLGLFILVAVSIVHALLTINAFEKTKGFLGYLLSYYFISRTISTPKRLKGVFWTLICIHVLIAVISFEVFTREERGGALSAGYFLGDGNDFGLSVNIVIPMAAFLFLNSRKFTAKALSGTFLLVLISLVILTQSRGASIALAAMLAYMSVRSKRKVIGAAFTGLIVLGVLVFASETYFKRMNSIAEYEVETSARARLDAWKAGWRMALDNPLLGVGAGNFPSVYGRFYRPVDAVYARWLSTHSAYVQCMAELGFTGLLLLIGLFLANFRDCAYMRTSIRSHSTDNPSLLALPTCLEASVIGLGINMAFLATFYYPHLFFITGIIVATRGMFSEETNFPQN